MNRLASADLPNYFPSDLELRLQDRPTLELLHSVGEANNYLFALGHLTIQRTAEPSVDNPLLTGALLLGVETYEVVASTFSTDTYSTEAERPVVAECVLSFVSDIKKADDFFKKADYAEERLLTDAPRLAEVLREVASRHVEHDKVATHFALRGAGVIRAMHIYVDRKLAA